MAHFWRWSMAIVLVGLVLVAAFWGWIEGRTAVDAVMGVIALVGLFSTLGKPWDLYFQAQRTVRTQNASATKGIAIAEHDRETARTLAVRLLGLCISLHLGAAILLTAVTWWTDGTIGYGFAVFYLVSIAFRPIEVGYRHVRSQLMALEKEALHPREDILAWVETVKRLDLAVGYSEERHKREQKELAARFVEVDRTIRESDERARGSERALDSKLDRVLGELDRTVDRLTDDRELVVGIRSLVKLIRGGK